MLENIDDFIRNFSKSESYMNAHGTEAASIIVWEDASGMSPTPRRILCALDLADDGSNLLSFAVEQSGRYNAKILVLHAIDSGPRNHFQG